MGQFLWQVLQQAGEQRQLAVEEGRLQSKAPNSQAHSTEAWPCPDLVPQVHLALLQLLRPQALSMRGMNQWYLTKLL